MQDPSTQEFNRNLFFADLFSRSAHSPRFFIFGLPQKVDKVALLIDGANLDASCKTLGFEGLLAFFKARGRLVRAFRVLRHQALAPNRPVDRLPP
jgi:hypothetical protein